MAEKSAASKRSKKPTLVFEPADFRRLFKYLPLKVFRKVTNIEQLIIAEYKKKHDDKSPPFIHINKSAEKRHHQMSTLDDWNGTILEQLDFNWPSKHKTHASIWSLPKDERDKIHSKANDHQKQFIYLPLHVFEEETNAAKLMYKEAKKSGQDLEKVNLYVQGLHPYLHVVDDWHPFMKKFKFNDDQTNDTDKIEGEPKESTNKSNKSQRSEPASSSKQTDVVKGKKNTEPIPSTSKQADQIASTSKQANVSKSSKGSETIPDTSKQVDSVTSKKSTDVRRSPRGMNQNKENDDGNQVRVTRAAGKRQSDPDQANTAKKPKITTDPIASTSKQADKIVSTPKRTNVAKGSNSGKLFSSKLNSTEPVTSAPKTAEIIRSPQKTVQSKETDNVNLKRTTQISEKRQSDPKHADDGRSAKGNESTSAADSSTSSKRKMVQSTLPNWMQSVSPVRVTNQDQGLLRLAKRPKATQHMGSIVRNIEKMNQLSNQTKPKEVANEPIHNNDEEQSIEPEPLIPSESTNARKEQPSDGSLEQSDEIIPTNESAQNTQSSSQTSSGAHRPREFSAEDLEREQRQIMPSDFQKDVQAMSFDEFITRTNIKEIVKNTHFKGTNDVPEEDMDIKLKYYYNFRMQTGNWLRNAIRNLKYIECKCTGKPNEMSRIDNHQPMNGNNVNQSQINRTTSSSSSRSGHFEPSEFQKEIIAMDFDTFVRETNVEQLVEKDFNEQFQGRKKFEKTHLEFGLNRYDELRMHPRRWHKNSLKNLKYKTCDCRRNKTFADKSIQTMQPMVQDAFVQCSAEFHGIEHIQTVKEKLASLTIHRLVEPEIVQAQNQIQSTESSEVSSSQSAQDVSTDIQGSGTQLTSSGSVTASGQEAPPQSQQIMTIEAVRMSELMLKSPEEQTVQSNARNPIETEAATENITDEPTTSHNVSNEAEVTYASQPIEVTVYASQSVGNSQFRVTPISQLQNSGSIDIPCHVGIIAESENNHHDVVVKTENLPLSYRLGDDSDVQIVFVPTEVFEISDSINTEEQFLYVDGQSEVNQSSNVSQSLLTVHTQSETPQRTSQQSVNEQANENVIEVDEEVLEEINDGVNEKVNEEADQQTSDKTPEEQRQELIRTLQGTPTIEDSDESIHISQIDGDFQAPRNPAPTTRFAKRSQQTSAQPQTSTLARKSKPSKEEDPLKNVPVPKYNYRPLDFHVRDRSEATATQTTTKHQAWVHQPQNPIEESQSSPDSSRNYAIDDSSSTDEANNSGMTTDSCVERANLLNQDNTLFLDINTQPAINSDGPTASQVNQKEDANAVQPDEAASLPIPGPSRSTVFNDQTEFLHYIDIQSVSSSLRNVILQNGERNNILNIETTLKHQCNGANRIVLMGNAIKLIMKMNDKEWDALYAILSALRDYKYDVSGQQSTNGTILHRAADLLFKSAPKISNVHISYGDQDLETARVFIKPNQSHENITAAIDPYVLEMMQATAQKNTK